MPTINAQRVRLSSHRLEAPVFEAGPSVPPPSCLQGPRAHLYIPRPPYSRSRRFKGKLDFITGPSPPDGVLKAQLVQNPSHNEVNEVIDALRVVVKAGRGGNDDGVPRREFGHVFEVDRCIGRFSRHDDEFASLFHGNDGRAGHEVVRDTRREFADGGARARTNDHGVDLGRAGGGLGTDVGSVFKNSVGGRSEFFGRGVALVLEGEAAGVGDDEANGLAHVSEHLGETLAVNGARGARDADDNLAHGQKAGSLPFSLLF